MSTSVMIVTWLLAASAQAADDSEAPTLTVLGQQVELQPTARVQVWATAYDMDENPQADPAGYGDPNADIGFAIRRARVGLTGTVGRTFWRVSAGMSSPYDQLSPSQPLVQIVDAYGGYAFDDARTTKLAIGVVEVPFARETLTSSNDLLFQERGVASAWLSPVRDVGVAFDTTQGLFRGRAGVYNGNGDLLGDDNDGVMAVARVELASGDAYRSYSAQGDNAFGVALAALYNDGLATQTLGLNADGMARVGPITAMVGVTRNTITPNSALVTSPEVFANTERIGFTGQLSAYVPLPSGGLEIGSRYSSIDDATALKDNGDVSIVHSGVSWRDAVPGVDIGAGYVLRIERQGRTVPNDTARLWVQFRYPFNDRS